MKKNINTDNPKGVEYPCAVTIDGTLVRAIDIDKSDKKWDNITFYFLGCEGDENEIMVFSSRRNTNGETKFFKHKPGYFPDSTEKDRYLHNYAEWVLKERFDNSEEFVVQYYIEEKCNFLPICDIKKISKCKGCGNLRLQSLNLKEQYDTCTLEKGVGEDKKYIADLLLENSKDNSIKPLLLEVYVTHKCTFEKQNSGYSIIEIKVKDELDAEKEIVENSGELINRYKIKKEKNAPAVTFYGIDRRSNFKDYIPCEEFRFGKYEDIYFGRINRIQCKDVPNSSRNNLLMDLTIPIDTLVKKKLDLYEIGFALAYANNMEAKNCVLCKRYKGNYPCQLNNKIYTYIDNNGVHHHISNPQINKLPHYIDNIFDKSFQATKICKAYVLDEKRQNKLASILGAKEIRLWLDASVPSISIQSKTTESVNNQEGYTRLVPILDCLNCFMYRDNCGHCKGDKWKEGKRYIVCDFDPHAY